MLLKIKRIKFHTSFIRIKIDNIDPCKTYCRYHQTNVVDGLLRYSCAFGTLSCSSVSDPHNEVNYTYIPTKRKGRT